MHMKALSKNRQTQEKNLLKNFKILLIQLLINLFPNFK